MLREIFSFFNCNIQYYIVKSFTQKKYRGAEKSLARPGRKQARKHVREARDFNNIETRTVKSSHPPCKARRRRKLKPLWHKQQLVAYGVYFHFCPRSQRYNFHTVHWFSAVQNLILSKTNEFWLRVFYCHYISTVTIFFLQDANINRRDTQKYHFKHIDNNKRYIFLFGVHGTKLQASKFSSSTIQFNLFKHTDHKYTVRGLGIDSNWCRPLYSG